MRSPEDSPTSAQLEYAELEAKAKQLLSDEWYASPDGEAYQKLEDEGLLLTDDAHQLWLRRCKFIEDNLDEYVREFYEQAAYQADEYKYYGVSRSDF